MHERLPWSVSARGEALCDHRERSARCMQCDCNCTAPSNSSYLYSIAIMRRILRAPLLLFMEMPAYMLECVSQWLIGAQGTTDVVVVSLDTEKLSVHIWRAQIESRLLGRDSCRQRDTEGNAQRRVRNASTKFCATEDFHSLLFSVCFYACRCFFFLLIFTLFLREKVRFMTQYVMAPIFSSELCVCVCTCACE